MKTRLIWLIQGTRPGTLQARLFNIAALMAVLFALMGTLINLLLGISAPLLLSGGALLFYALIFAWSRIYGRTRLAQELFVYGSLALLSLIWFENAGVVGSVSYLYFAVGVIALVVLPRRSSILFWLVLMLNLGGLILLEQLFPGWVVPYPNPTALKLDLALTSLMSLMLICASVFLFRYYYDQEHELLEKATQYKSRFLATMSHDLRTPLNAVLGFTRVLQSGRAGPLNPQQLQYLERMQGNGMQLLQLVNDLLDLSRIEAGSLAIDQRETSLNRLIQDSMAHFQPRAEAQGLSLKLEAPDSLPVLKTDPGRLLQVLNNLIDNALKYTSRGSISLRIVQEVHELLIQVNDTGPGIAPEHQALIFQPFYQVAGTGRSGVGLGLAITFQLCQLLGYRLSLRSEPGKGSSFTIGIPTSSEIRPSDAAV